MLFNSINFIAFLPIVLGLFLLLRNHWRATKVLLLLSSYLFYMGWNPPFVLLLIFSTLLDYVAGRSIASSDELSKKRIWLIASCSGNLGVLAFFKYGQFFSQNFDMLFNTHYANTSLFDNWILPVGISFYTFQSLSYTIDVYRDPKKVESNVIDFALYVSFFPQLVAGPIIRSTVFLPQLKQRGGVGASDTLSGLDQICRGYAKKVLIADNLAPYVDSVFAQPEVYGSANQLLALYAYAFQIYCDFSGYSDIAIGVARLMGFKLTANFNLPYLAKGPSDFWRRWHISLSTWLRDYLYISLGGNRAGHWKTNRNLFITMFLAGLWHGAGWGFILFGVFHGTWLIIHRILTMKLNQIHVPHIISIIATFHIWIFSLVFFRDHDIEASFTIIRHLFDFSTPVYMVPIQIPVLIMVGFISHILGNSSILKNYWQHSAFYIRCIFYVSVIIFIFLTASDTQQFVYFQF